MRFALFDRWGNQLGTLGSIVKAEWTEELNGEDTLEIVADEPMGKGQRVVWCDGQGLWHEHVVASVSESHDDEGCVRYTADCENSISELYGDWIGDKRPENATASTALSVALEPSRWEVGAVTVTGANSTNIYRESAREAVQKVAEAWGGELSATIEIDGANVTARKVNLTRRGTDNGRRFVYGKDMASIRRTFDADDVVTALHGYGKGEAVGDGYGRGIDFSAINGGKDYIEDAEALEAWGRPDGKGGKAHVFGRVEFSDCDDPAELLRLTKAEHEKRKVPKVSYESSVSAFAGYGYDFADVGIGDDVALIDRAFEPEVRVKGRVTKIVRDLLDDGKPTAVTIGNIIDGAADIMAKQYAELHSLTKRATGWDVAAYTPPAYIQQVMDGLNRQFDAGASYIYQSPEQGIIVGSVPLDPDTGKPKRTPASAIQLKGGGFRIANTVRSNGEFDWRAFGTGDGFVADEIATGVLKGGNARFDLNTGTITVTATLNGEQCSVVLGGASGMSIYAGGKLIGGLQVVNGRVCSVSDRLKSPGGASYLACGKMDDGAINAIEFVTNGNRSGGSLGQSFGILPLYDNQSNRLSGYGRFSGRKMHEIVLDDGLRIGFRGTQIDPDKQVTVEVAAPYLWCRDTSGGIYINEDRYIVINDVNARIQWKKDWACFFNDDGFFVRCGGKGFGWMNGKFMPEITYSN